MLNVKKIFNICWLLLMCIPLIPQQWVSYVIIVWGIIGLATFDKKLFSHHRFFYFLILSSPFFLYLIQALISNDSNDWFSVEKSNSYWIFPLIILFSKFIPEGKNADQLQLIFVFSIVGIAILSCVYFIINGFELYPNIPNDFFSIYRENMNRLLRIHPSYLSVMCAFSIIILFNRLHTVQKKHPLHFILICLLIVFMFFLSARLVWIALTITCGLLLIIRFIRHHISWKWILTSILIISSIIGMTLLNPRWGEFISFKQDTVQDNSLSVRAVIYTCSYKSAQKHYLVGTTTAIMKKELSDCFGESPVFRLHQFNTHNQYFDFLISFGLLGWLILFGILGLSFYIGIRDKNMLHISFVMLFIICLLGENMLSRQSGLVFFMLFNTWFIAQSMNSSEKSSL